jgi:hypothetical protein
VKKANPSFPVKVSFAKAGRRPFFIEPATPFAKRSNTRANAIPRKPQTMNL